MTEHIIVAIVFIVWVLFVLQSYWRAVRSEEYGCVCGGKECQASKTHTNSRPENTQGQEEPIKMAQK